MDASLFLDLEQEYGGDDAQLDIHLFMPVIVENILQALGDDTSTSNPPSMLTHSSRQKWEGVVNALLVFYHHSCTLEYLPSTLTPLIERILRSSEYAIRHVQLPMQDAIGLDLHWLPKEPFSAFLPSAEWEFSAEPSGIRKADGLLSGLYYEGAGGRQEFFVSWQDRMRLLHGDLFLNLLQYAPALPNLRDGDAKEGKLALEVYRRLWDIAHETARDLHLAEWAGQLRARLVQHAHYERDAIWAFGLDRADTLMARDWMYQDTIDYVYGRSTLLLREALEQTSSTTNSPWWEPVDDYILQRMTRALSREFLPRLEATLLPEEGEWSKDVDPRSAHWYLQSRCDIWIIYLLQCFLNRIPPARPMMLIFGRFLDQLSQLYGTRQAQGTIPLELLPTRYLPTSVERFSGKIGGMRKHGPVRMKVQFWLARLDSISSHLNDGGPDIEKLDKLHKACGDIGLIFTSFLADALDSAPEVLQRRVMEILLKSHELSVQCPSLRDVLPDPRVMPSFWLAKMAFHFKLVSIADWKTAAVERRHRKKTRPESPEDVRQRDGDSHGDLTRTLAEPRELKKAGGGGVHLAGYEDDMMDIDSGAPDGSTSGTCTGAWETSVPADTIEEGLPVPMDIDDEPAAPVAQKSDDEIDGESTKKGPRNTTKDAAPAARGRCTPTIVSCTFVPAVSLRPVLDDPRRSQPKWKDYYERGPWNISNRDVRIAATAEEGARGKLPPYTPKMDRAGFRVWLPVILTNPNDFSAETVRRYGMVLVQFSNGTVVEVAHGIYRCTRCMQGQGKRSKLFDSPWFEFCWRVPGDSCHPCKIKNKPCQFRNAKCDRIAPLVWDSPLVGKQAMRALPTAERIQRILGPGLGIGEPLPMSKNAQQALRKRESLENQSKANERRNAVTVSTGRRDDDEGEDGEPMLVEMPDLDDEDDDQYADESNEEEED